MTNTNTTNTNITIISDLMKSDKLVDLIVVSINYKKWVPQIDNISIFSSPIPAILTIINSIKAMESPYDKISDPDYEWGLSRKVTNTSGSMGRHYAWAKQFTDDPSYFRETRIYLCENNKPIFTSKLMDGFDEFVNEYFNKAAE